MIIEHKKIRASDKIFQAAFHPTVPDIARLILYPLKDYYCSPCSLLGWRFSSSSLHQPHSHLISYTVKEPRDIIIHAWVFVAMSDQCKRSQAAAFTIPEWTAIPGVIAVIIWKWALLVLLAVDGLFGMVSLTRRQARSIVVLGHIHCLIVPTMSTCGSIKKVLHIFPCKNQGHTTAVLGCDAQLIIVTWNCPAAAPLLQRCSPDTLLLRASRLDFALLVSDPCSFVYCHWPVCLN